MTSIKIGASQSIYTGNPEQEIWNWIADLAGEQFVYEFAQRRFADKAFGKNIRYVNKIKCANKKDKFSGTNYLKSSYLMSKDNLSAISLTESKTNRTVTIEELIEFFFIFALSTLAPVSG